jgi:hypothetical protein
MSWLRARKSQCPWRESPCVPGSRNLLLGVDKPMEGPVTSAPILSSIGRRIVQGMLVAASGAFVWSSLCFFGNTKGSLFEIITFSAYALFLTSWFVLPIGGVLGLTMPRLVRGCSAIIALLRGALVGICVGLMAAVLTIIFTEWPTLFGTATIVDRTAWEHFIRHQFGSYLTTMTPICAAWVGIWALRLRRKVLPDSGAPANRHADHPDTGS